MARRDVRLADLLRADIDGVPLDLAARLLPGRTRLNFGLAAHVHLHARAQQRHAGRRDEAKAARAARIAASRLERAHRQPAPDGRGLDWKPAGTEWADYADHTSYGDAARPTRPGSSAVRGQVPVRGRWDLGANTGRYSRIAADAG